MKKDIKQLVRSNVLELKGYSSARDEYAGKDAVFLDANESPTGDWNRYPDPYQTELKTLLATQSKVEPNQICIGNGSDEILDLILRVFGEPGKDKILNFPPTYGMYEVLSELNDLQIINLPRLEDFEIDKEIYVTNIEFQKVKLTLLCSPNNPSGNTISTDDLELILQNTQGIVVVDEAYVECFEDQDFVPLLAKYNNLILCRTLSKAWGLAACRIGYAIASAEIIALLNKVKAPYNVSTPNQLMAQQRLSTPNFLSNNLKRIVNEREKLVLELQKSALVKQVYPSQTNFLLVQFKAAKVVFESLRKEGVVVRNWSGKIPNALRISIGTPSENQKLITELQKLEDEKSIVYR